MATFFLLIIKVTGLHAHSLLRNVLSHLKKQHTHRRLLVIGSIADFLVTMSIKYLKFCTETVYFMRPKTKKYFQRIHNYLKNMHIDCSTLFWQPLSISMRSMIATKQKQKQKTRAVCIILRMMCFMMTSSNGNIFRVTGPLCGEFTGSRWIPHTKASDAGLWCLLWSAE